MVPAGHFFQPGVEVDAGADGEVDCGQGGDVRDREAWGGDEFLVL